MCFGHVLITYILNFRFWHWGWIEHVLHIFSSFDGIGGSASMERGEIQWRGGDILHPCLHMGWNGKYQEFAKQQTLAILESYSRGQFNEYMLSNLPKIIDEI